MNKTEYDYSPFIERLKSSDFDILADALSELSGLHEAPPTGVVRQLIIKHLDNSDLEVKEWAIRASGMHWKFTEAYKKIYEISQDSSQQEDIIEKALASLNCYALNDDDKKSSVNIALGRYIQNEKWSFSSRIYIYNLFLHLNEEMSLLMLANKGVRKIQNKIDYDLVNKIMVSSKK